MSITQTSSKESNIGLISDEERAALGKVRLEDDVSESSVGTETKTPSLVVEKQVAKFIGPPIPVNRDGMGRYVVPPNGRPLTFNDVPTPGPANYAFDFNFITHKFPVFSLGERPPEPKRSKQKRIPGPNKYNVQGNAVWGKCKKFPMGIKTFTSDVKPSPGPAAYNLQSQKPTGPKYSIGSKDENIIGGLMSKLVFIPDPRNPGPDFCPSSDEWLQKPKSFGIPYEKRRRSKAPGPGRYKVPDTLGGPKWKMGTKTSNVKPVDMPGPANYGFKSTIGDGPKYHIGRVAPENLSKFITPGADMYNRAGFRLDEPGFTLKYRWFDSKPKKSPGPWTYKVKEEMVSTRTPAYTISKKTKPTYPASLYSAVGPDGPGPGDYNLPEVIDLNGKSFGEKHAESGKK
ncbi:proteoglycan 4, partial [Biomphalaria glabrata]